MHSRTGTSALTEWTPAKLRAVMQPLWLGQISDRAAGLLLERGRIVRFKLGEVIVEQGAPSRGLHILLAGEAKVDSVGPNGREFTRSIVGPGEGYSFLHIYHADPHSSSLCARSACEVLIVSKADWMMTTNECPELKDAVIGIITHRFKIALEMLDLNDSATSLGRLAHRLLWQVRKTPAVNAPDPSGKPFIDLQISQAELAKMLSVSRQRTNALLHQLEQTGAITQHYGLIRINDLERLRKVIVDDQNGLTNFDDKRLSSR